MLLGFIQSYGYAFVFFCTLLEGETVVALAGFVAYQGYLNIMYVVLVAIVGAVIGDQAYYNFGRFKGKQFIAKREKFKLRVASAQRLIERHQNWLIFGSRFMYGFRTILPIAIGTSNVTWAKFSLFNFLGSVVWGTFFAVGGYAFGNALERFIGHVKRAEKFIIIGVIVGALLVSGITFLHRRVAATLEEEERRSAEEQSHSKE